MNRRLFSYLFASLASVGAGYLGLADAEAQSPATITLKIQSSYPGPITFFEHLKMFADRVDRMSGGRVKVDALPAGTIVPALEVLDATNKKVIDGAHTYAGYWVGKHKAAVLFGGSPGGPFGMDMFDYFGWLYEGGGLELYEEFYRDVLKMSVVPLPVSTGPPSSLGWFKKPIKSWADFKGIKLRAAGIGGEVYKEAGATVVSVAGGEIVPAGERGVIDAAEFLGGADDLQLGFARVWKIHYGRSIHEYTFTTDILINSEVWARLPSDLKEIVRSASLEASVRWVARYARRNAEATNEMREKHNVQVLRTPIGVMQKFLETWDLVAQREAARDPFFKRVLDSQRKYASLIVPYRLSMWPNYDFAANHYWKDAVFVGTPRVRQSPKK